jgi:rhamnosyltransferase
MGEIFIIGSKGIPARYGGFETFVEQLTRHRKNEDIHYHVACMGTEKKEFVYQESHCFQIPVPSIGPAKAVWYDLAAFSYCLRYARRHPSDRPIVYVLACRIGPFAGWLKRKLKKLGGELYVPSAPTGNFPNG